MKIWYEQGSEHSANLVMIGRFKEIEDAQAAKEVLDTLIKEVMEEERQGKSIPGSLTDRYSDEMLKLLGKLNIGAIGPMEIEQFIYDIKIELHDKEIVLLTEEVDVSAFIKVLIDKGARIEIYSAHDYPGTGHGRGG
ncbi:MAG: DUF6375 family protein [Spirochaetia bacterium]|jgi:hypothetical protein